MCVCSLSNDRVNALIIGRRRRENYPPGGGDLRRWRRSLAAADCTRCIFWTDKDLINFPSPFIVVVVVVVVVAVPAARLTPVLAYTCTVSGFPVYLCTQPQTPRLIIRANITFLLPFRITLSSPRRQFRNGICRVPRWRHEKVI